MSRIDNGKKEGDLKVVIGLGNPGDEYADTYHNAGAIAVYGLSGAGEGDFHRVGNKPFRYIKNGGVVFVIPETYMNESGLAVNTALDYFNAGPENLILIHDDSDIEVGKYKISSESGSAGHNGVKSTFDALGTERFTRVRIGVRGAAGTAGGERKKADEFVLKRMLKDDREKIEATFEEIKTKLI